MTGLGDFLKFLATNFHSKVSQICGGDFLNHFEIHHFHVNTAMATTFEQFFGIILASFVLASRHGPLRNHILRVNDLCTCELIISRLVNNICNDLKCFVMNFCERLSVCILLTVA